MAQKTELEKLEQRYRENPSQWFAALADSYRKAGELDLALEVVQSGIVDRPDYSSAQIVLGRILLDLGRDREASKAFQRVLDLDAENIIALKTLSELAELRGDIPLAQAWLKRLLEVDPLNEEAEAALDRLGPVERTVALPGDAGSSPSHAAFIDPSELEDIAIDDAQFDAVEHTAEPRDAGPEPQVDGLAAGAESAYEDTPFAASADSSSPPEAPSAEIGDEAEIEQEEGVESSADAERAWGEVVIDDRPSSVGSLREQLGEEDAFEIETTDLKRDEREEEAAPQVLDGVELVNMAESAPDEERDATGVGDTVPDADLETLELERESEDLLVELDMEASGEPEAPLIETSRIGDQSTELLIEHDLDTAALFPQSRASSPDDFDFDLEDMFEEEGDLIAPDSAGVAEASPFDAIVGSGTGDALPSADDLVEDVMDEPTVLADERLADEFAGESAASEDATELEVVTGEADGPDAGRGSEPEPVVTTTMAEVYAQQGLHREAAAIYEQLLGRDPDDGELQQRLEALRSLEPEQGDVSTGLPPRVSRYSVAHTGGVSARVALQQIFSVRLAGPREGDDIVGAVSDEPTASNRSDDENDDGAARWRDG